MKFGEIKGQKSRIPQTSGVYYIELPENFDVRILEKSEGQRIASDYPVDELKCKLDKGDGKIVYIGKANGRRNNLQRRLVQFYKFAYGLCLNHKGGRGIFQIENWKDLDVRWEVCEDAAEEERKLLEQYKEKCGVLPFANWII